MLHLYQVRRSVFNVSLGHHEAYQKVITTEIQKTAGKFPKEFCCRPSENAFNPSIRPSTNLPADRAIKAIAKAPTPAAIPKSFSPVRDVPSKNLINSIVLSKLSATASTTAKAMSRAVSIAVVKTPPMVSTILCIVSPIVVIVTFKVSNTSFAIVIAG